MQKHPYSEMGTKGAKSEQMFRNGNKKCKIIDNVPKSEQSQTSIRVFTRNENCVSVVYNKKSHDHHAILNGGAWGIRTPDLLIANQTLSQLS